MKKLEELIPLYRETAKHASKAVEALNSLNHSLFDLPHAVTRLRAEFDECVALVETGELPLAEIRQVVQEHIHQITALRGHIQAAMYLSAPFADPFEDEDEDDESKPFVDNDGRGEEVAPALYAFPSHPGQTFVDRRAYDELASRLTVDPVALRRVLAALNGSAHMIRELQVTRRLPGGDKNPIDLLTDQYNAWAAGEAGKASDA